MDGLRVLVVEDEPDLLTTLAEAIAGWGHDAAVADTVDQAIDLVRGRPLDAAVAALKQGALDLARASRVSLAVLDTALLDMSGGVLASLLRDLDPDIGLVVTSREYQPEVELRAREIGALYWAPKPVSVEVLEAIALRLRARQTSHHGTRRA